MAYILLRRPLPRTPIFTSHIRSSPIPRVNASAITRRSFHATSPRKFNPFEPIISGTSSSLLTLHAILPWYAVIPLAAVSVRFILLPLTLWSRGLLRKQVSLFPLIHAWRHAIHRRIIRSPTAGKLAPSVIQKTEAKLVRQKQKELYKTFGCQQWKAWIPSLPRFGMFLVMIESIRGLVGAREGILRLAFGNDSALIKVPESVSTAGDRVENAVVGLVDKLPIDPALTTEGMLWFQDLTAPDPQLILPFMLSATIFANMIPKHYFTGAPAPPKAAELPLPQRVLGRLMKIFALAIGPLTLGMPSGLLLYWISSSTLTLLESLGLDVFKPLPKSVKPCKPPVSNMVSQYSKKKVETPMRDNLKARLLANRGPSGR